MIKGIKRIFLLLLIGIFLLPSMGFLLYVQQCNISNAITIKIEEEDLCCKSELSESKEDSGNGLLNLSKNFGSDLQILSILPCCKLDKIYIKLGAQLVNKTGNYFKSSYTIINNATPVEFTLLAYYINNKVLIFPIKPPGIPDCIEYTSLRI